ncbi:hypothetical protein AVEN_26845-1 [Araneus ventricosus]|uniref:Uncharacterized protein n=1 Tax=Araneus ventricosus TaxID=182803 RepID=A0A4Y2V1J0_ARAVE|nr:hypothetical protein AVEN_26845-1 [Araneus ventricosus]
MAVSAIDSSGHCAQASTHRNIAFYRSTSGQKSSSQFSGFPRIINNTLQLNVPLLQKEKIMPQEFKIKIEAEAPLKIKTQVGDGKDDSISINDKPLRLGERHRCICRTVKSISRNHPGKNRCPESEGSSSRSSAPLHCFGSDVPIVLTSMEEKGELTSMEEKGELTSMEEKGELTSMEEKGESLMGQDRGLATSSKNKTPRGLLPFLQSLISVRSFGTHLHLFPALKSAL